MRPAARAVAAFCFLWLLASALALPVVAADPPPGTIGVRVQPAPEELGKAPLVAAVTSGGRGALAGLQVGDQITSINGQPLASPDDFVSKVKGYFQKGRLEVVLEVKRYGRSLSITVPLYDTVATAPAPKAPAPAPPASPPAPARVAVPAAPIAEPPAPVAATTESGIVEPRLGMEFAPLPGGKDGAIFVRSWNTLPLYDGTRPTAKPGERLTQIISYLADPPNPDEPFENIAVVRGPQYVPIILDSILRSGKARHDLVTLVFLDSDTVVPVRLLPAGSPVPTAPPVAAVTPPPAAPAAVTTPAASGSTRLAVTSIGIELVTLPSQYGGVTIGKVVQGSLAESALLLAGDRIMQVDGTAVATAANAAREIERVVQRGDSSLRLSMAGVGNSLRHVDLTLREATAPVRRTAAPSGSTLNLTLVMSAILALVLVAFAVARHKGWGRGFTFLPVRTAPAGFAPPVPGMHDPDDEEEREIAFARQAVQTAERSPIQGPAPAETGGPSWFQQQRERREVERARRSMEEAERAARGQALPHGHYPYPPPPYGYYQQRTPFSEKLRVAYWGLKIALVMVVAVWAWSVTGTVVSMLGAIVPAPLRAVTVDLLAKAQDAINKADTK